MNLRLRFPLVGSASHKIDMIEIVKKKMKPLMVKWTIRGIQHITERVENDDYYTVSLKTPVRKCKCKKGERINNCLALKHMLVDISKQFKISVYKKYFFLKLK